MDLRSITAVGRALAGALAMLDVLDVVRGGQPRPT
jgi:hypothetical protein